MARMTAKPPVGGARAMQRAQFVRVESPFRQADGTPRFVMTINAAYLQDPGIRALVRGEGEDGGYEYPARAFLDAHLEPGDLFIDVGAHWGVYSLHAATRHRGDVKVIAIEPHPGNIAPLLGAINANGLAGAIEVVSVAAGADPGTAPLIFNSTMGHSLHGFGLPADAKRLGTLTVPVLPLDLIVREREGLAGRRIIIKIDVEGFEPEVVAGAAGLLDAGRVAAVIWEHGSAYAMNGSRGEAMAALCRALEDRGFRQYRFPHPSMGGPLVPFAPTPECFNVFALSPAVQRRPVYPKPRPHPEPLSKLTRAPAAPAVRDATTRMLMARRATDAARWADFEAMRPGAEARARLAAAFVPAAARVLDLGAGVMALRRALPAGCRYQPADLVAFAEDTLVVDLNDGQFPGGNYDVAVFLDVLEFLHDPQAALDAAADRAGRLIASYRPCDGPSAGGSPLGAATETGRRSLGFFNDYSEADMSSLLSAAGWSVDRRAGSEDFALFIASRRDRSD
jgi:FkbM family methyltransferase